MPVKNPRSRFQDENLREWGSTRRGADYAMPGTSEGADPTAPPSVAFHGCKVRKSANQAVTNTNNDVIVWQINVFDTDNLHKTTTTTSRFTVPQGLAGFWRLDYQIQINTGTHNNKVDIHLRKNANGASGGGTGIQAFRGVIHAVTGDQGWLGGDTFRLEAGDYVELFAEALGENVTLQSGGAGGCFAIFEYRGPVANAEIE